VGQVKLEQSDGEKDIGVLVDETISFSTHIQNQINKTNSIMGLIRRTYTYLDEQSFKYLFQVLVRPHLEYAAAVWCPYKSGEIEQIENVQRRAMKWHPVFDRIFMSIEKSYLHSWHFQWLSRPISNYFTVLATIISSGKLFQISTTLPVNEYFLTFSLHDCFFSFLLW
jgi:hypothetical protein